MSEDAPSPDAEAPDEPADQDPEDVMYQADPGPERSRTYRVFQFVVEHVMLIVAAVGLLAFAIAGILDYTIPRYVRVIGVVALITIPFVGRPTAKKVRAMLWDPGHVWIVDIDARVTKGAIYRTPAQQFREWDVTDGQIDWVSPHLCFAKNVNLIEQTLEGTWRGTLNDRELMRALQAVDECRGQLEEDAKRGFAVESQAFTIIRNATRDAVLRVVSTFERGTLPDEGEGVTDQINSAIEQFDLERKIRRSEENDPPESQFDNLDDLVEGSLNDSIEASSPVQGVDDD